MFANLEETSSPPEVTLRPLYRAVELCLVRPGTSYCAHVNGLPSVERIVSFRLVVSCPRLAHLLHPVLVGLLALGGEPIRSPYLPVRLPTEAQAQPGPSALTIMKLAPLRSYYIYIYIT